MNVPKKLAAKPMSRKNTITKNSNADSKKLIECQKKIEEYERNMKVVLQERDFYFQKIVEIEKNCLTEEFKDDKLSKIICSIMYDEEETVQEKA